MLDDCTYAFTNLEHQPKLHECSRRHFRGRKCLIKPALVTFSSTVWLQFERETFRLPALGFGDVVGRRYAHLIARPWIPISLPMTYMTYLLQFLSYSVGSKSVSDRPTWMMTNTMLEAISSSSSNKTTSFKCLTFNIRTVHHSAYIRIFQS